MALDRGAAATGEEAEPLVDERGDLSGVHAHDPRRRQLDRERDAVESSADLGDGGRVGLVEREPRSRGTRPVDEQRRRVARGDGVGRLRRVGE